ncbi:hypothetical protein BG015_007960 [Linnemannia schmuckeri]|uniref:F-box domain-containing protein n=1 Tax=Linnemannia schmuckeri TaxID=64567 RepID=A0A9P5S5Y1_9FUNG|nr:hypothetical protein BG015_007960 [Linnemannia schmuckeri]
MNKWDHPSSTSPLAIPEILARIGYFLPLWVPDGHGNYDDEPHTIVNCMLVSKRWYAVMVPILWHTCLSARITATPPHVLGRFLTYIRILQTNMFLPLVAFQCDRLVKLSILMRRFQWDIDDNGSESHSRSLHCYKRLVRSNSRLKDLLWNGKFCGNMTTLDLEDFAGLIQLESLILISWDGSGGRLAGALRAVASTPTNLTLKDVAGYKGGVFVTTGHDGSSMDTEGNKNDGKANSGRGSGQGAVVTTTLCMPVLRDLVLDNTERSCPPLKPGLQQLSLNLQELGVDVVSGILLHASTLKTLGLSIQHCYTSCSPRVLQLLGGCSQHLESLSLTIYLNYGNDLSVGQGPEGDDAESQVLEKEKEDKKEEERDIEALRAMTSTRPAMGWRLDTDRQPDGLPPDWQQLRRVFKMVDRLGLDGLHTLEWDRVTYRRATSP